MQIASQKIITAIQKKVRPISSSHDSKMGYSYFRASSQVSQSHLPSAKKLLRHFTPKQFEDPPDNYKKITSASYATGQKYYPGNALNV